MADEQPPRDRAGAGDGAGDEADQTRVTPPEDDGATQVRGAPAEEAPASGGEPTTVLPLARDDRWTARAGVPPPRVRDAYPEPGWQEPGEGGRWWAPAAIALVAVVLLGILALGIWLILRSRDTPLPTPTVAPQTPPATSTAAPPTTPAAPSATLAPQVPVPPLVGLSAQDARAVLDSLGLRSREETRVDGSARPGTVIATVPGQGVPVAPGGTVTLVVAAAPPTSAAPSPSPSASADTDG